MRTKVELIEAVCAGDLRFVLAALRSGTSPDGCYRGSPLLLWAVQAKRLNIVKALVRAGASLEKKDDDGFSPLDQAVGEGNAEIVSFLLKSGASVKRRTANGTPLHTACAYRRLQIAKLLLAYGADANALDKEGKTPLDHVSKRGNSTDKALRKLLNRSLVTAATEKPKQSGLQG